jgi:hypothetical protein
MSDLINTLAVSNTKLAAALLALGFSFKAELVQPTKTGEKLHTQFLFFGRSQRTEYANVSLKAAKDWQEGSLEKSDPMHPLCVMMWANHNYDRLLDWQNQAKVHSLVLLPSRRLYVYRAGTGDWPRGLLLCLDDMALVAALGGLGIPVCRIEGAKGHYLYTVPETGFQLMGREGLMYQENARSLIARAPTAQDPFRLALEDNDPLHPLVMMYDVLHCRAHLKKAICATNPLLLMQEEGTDKQALITMNSQGRVMDRVARHFKAPKIDWKR